MVYRAKITHIRSYIESIYNINAYSIVHDKKDWYIEVRDEDEADLIESINSLQARRTQLEIELSIKRTPQDYD